VRYLADAGSYPKDDAAKIIPETPKLSLRWFGIASACLSLDKIRSTGGGRIGDSEELIGRDRLDDEATCNDKFLRLVEIWVLECNIVTCVVKAGSLSGRWACLQTKIRSPFCPHHLF